MRAMSSLARSNIAIAACTFALSAGGDAALQIFPAGKFRGRDGRPRDADAWFIDKAVAERVIADARSRKTEIVIDYEHQTLRSDDNGRPAPAAGWYTGADLEWREGQGLYAAAVKWNDRARQHIDAGEYKYYSPVFLYKRGTGEVLSLLHGGITNFPAVDGMDALASRAAARFDLNLEESMNEEMLKLLGLKPDATDEEVKTAITALKAASQPNATLLKALSLGDGATFADVETAAVKLSESLAAAKSEANPDPSKYVSIETMTELQTEVASLRAENTRRDVDELVNDALEAGKLLPAQEKWARELGETNIAQLKSYIENAPAIPALKRQQTGGKTPDGGDGTELSETTLAVARMFGNSEEDLRKRVAASA